MRIRSAFSYFAPLAIIALASVPASALITVGSMDLADQVSDIAVVGEFAYVISRDGGLQVIDVSNPTEPMETGSVDGSGDLVDIEVLNGLAYVADRDGAVRIFDVSNPNLPVEVGIYTAENLSVVHSVQVIGQLVYVCGYGVPDGGGLRIVDVANPTEPVEIGHFPVRWDTYDVEVVGGIAYLANGSYAHKIVDVSNPTSPIELGAFVTPPHAVSISIAGAVAYLSADFGLHAFDVSNPAEPIALDVFEELAGDELEVFGDVGYLFDAHSGLRVLDVSNPVLPKVLSGLDAMGGVMGGAVENGFAYLITGSPDLRVIDLSNAQSPAVIGELDAPGSVIEVVDGIAYVLGAQADRSLRVIDVTHPTSPVEIGSGELVDPLLGNFGFSDLEIVEDLAYVTFGSSARDGSTLAGLKIVDISEPSSPTEIGAWFAESGYSVGDVEVSDDIAYVSTLYDGLKILDVSNPTSPVDVGTLVTPSFSVSHIEFDGGLAYVSNYEIRDRKSNITVYDISNLRVPIEIGTYEFPHSAEIVGFVVEGDLIYLITREEPTGWAAQLRVFDVSNPAAIEPINESNIALPIMPSVYFSVVGDLALVTGQYGTAILDVSNPASPVELGMLGRKYWLFNSGFDLDTEFVYVVDDLGLQIFDLGPEYPLGAAFFDAFQCYGARASSRPSLLGAAQVDLSDTFGDRVDRAGRVREFCAPVDVDGLGITDSDANLSCHDLMGPSFGELLRRRQRGAPLQPRWEAFNVVVDNEFGEAQYLTVREPEQLCVASTVERREARFAPADSSGLPLDHFQCYGVEPSGDLPSFDPFEVSLSDFLGDATRRVGDPTKLCAPVDVDGQGVINSDAHLACYEVEDLDRRSRHRRTRVLVSNQFGEEQRMTLRGAKTVCVPSDVEFP